MKKIKEFFGSEKKNDSKHELSQNVMQSTKNYESVSENIRTRWSCKSYTSQRPTDKLIYDIIKTAQKSPKSGNISNYHTILVNKSDIITKIANISYQQSWIAQAPIVIVVTCSFGDLKSLYPDNYERFAIQNASSYIQNLLLLIHSAGLSSCWVESYQEEILKDLLGVSSEDQIHAVLPIGFANELPTTGKHIPELMMVLSYNSYGNKSNR